MDGAAPTVPFTRSRTPHDVVVDGTVLELLAKRAPLTIIRGPRGYGKTTTLSTWFGGGGPGHLTVALRLTRASNDAAHFWSELDSALVDVDLLPANGAQGTDHRERAMTGLSEVTEPLTVVIDDYHHAGGPDGAADIDDDLLELVRQNDQLFLVVSTRTTRVIETTGSLSVDVAMISPKELRLDGPQVSALAARIGVSLNDREAGRLATGFGGWPAAIRDVLVRSRGDGGRLNLALADEYIAAMVRDLRHEQVRRFLLHTAVPERFDAELAQLVAPGDSTLTILRNVRSAGLLREEIDEGQRTYSYAPFVRQALLRLLSESRPDELRAVHQRLMGRSLQERNHLEVLVHAIHAGAWSTAEQVMEDEWHFLVTQEPAMLMAAAQAIPSEVVAQHARFRVARDEVDGALLGGEPDPQHIWPTGDIRGITAELSPRRTRSGVDPTSFALLQWGVAAVIAGDESSALYAFGRARTLAQETDGSATAVRLATAGLACTHAIYGDVGIAASWLEDETLEGVGDESHDDYAQVGYWVRLAHAIVALDRLDPDMDDRVAALPERTRRDEVWGMGVLVAARHAAITGGPREVARWAANVRAARHYLPHGRMAEMALRTTEVEVLLAGGRLEEARHAAKDLPPSAVTMSTHAQLALLAGEYRHAVSRARNGLSEQYLSHRSVIECQLVLAAAHFALGERAAARATFAEAIRSAYASGQRRPLLILRHRVFAALAGEDLRVLELWPEAFRPPAEESQEEVGGGLVELLTPRELEILQALHQHAGAVPIAQELRLSVNTVKSHLRSIYQKLNVTNRAGALQRADEIDRPGARSGAAAAD